MTGWIIAGIGWMLAIFFFTVLISSSNKVATCYAENNVLRMALSDHLQKSWLERQKEGLDELQAQIFPEHATAPVEEPVAIDPEPMTAMVDERETLLTTDNKRTITRHMRQMGFSDEQIRRVTDGRS